MKENKHKDVLSLKKEIEAADLPNLNTESERENRADPQAIPRSFPPRFLRESFLSAPVPLSRCPEQVAS